MIGIPSPAIGICDGTNCAETSASYKIWSSGSLALDRDRGKDHPPSAQGRPEDRMLVRSLLKVVPEEAALLIVGYVDQLASVGPG